jgi:hypothetical protein
MSASAVVERVVTGLILLNIPVALICELTRNEIAEAIDLGLLVAFAAEILVRAVRAAVRRERDVWLAFDAIVVAVALLPLGASLPAVRGARLLHLGRHVQHATVARLAHGAR